MKLLSIIVIVILIAAAILGFEALIIMIPWNNVIVPLFAAKQVTYLMAMEIALIISIIGSVLRGHK